MMKDAQFSRRMNQLFGIYAVSLAFVYLGIFTGMQMFGRWTGVLAAVVLLIGSVPLYYLGKKKKRLRLLNPVANSLAVGFAVGAYDTHKHLAVSLTGGLPVFCACLLLMLLMLLILSLVKMIRFRRSFLVAMMVLIAAGVVLAVGFRSKNAAIFSLVVFLTLFTLSFLCGVIAYITAKNRLWFCVSVAYFAVAAIVIFAVIVVLTEGDVLDGGFDFDFSAGKSPKNQRKIR